MARLTWDQVWGYERVGTRLTVTVEPFGKLSASRRRAIAEEADRLGRFLASPVSVSLT
jgi:hypothetical protein